MELVTSPCAVLLSRIVQPVVFCQHRVYWLNTESGRFVSAHPPLVFDLNGEPMILHTELEIGSIVRVHSEDGYLRSVQIMRRKVNNPFVNAA